jgi:hypothetical protein
LRYFRDNNEWYIIRLNKEFEISNNLYFYSEKNQSIYSLAASKATEVVYDNNPKEPNIIKLNLVNKRNEILGNFFLNFSFTKNYKIGIQSLNLLMTDLNDEAYLLDFENNIVYKNFRNNATYEDFIFAENTYQTNICFELDNKVYYITKATDSLHTLEISMKDFKKEPYPLYTPIHSYQPYILLTIILVILLSIFVYIFTKKQSKRKTLQIPTEPENKNQNGFIGLEKELIDMIIDQSNKNLPTSVEELNKILGLTKKPIEFQKRIRTETITQINTKFKKLYNQETDLIERIRGEHDKRFFNYIISKENSKIVENGS